MNKDFILEILKLLPDKWAYLPFKYIVMGKTFHEWMDLLEDNAVKSKEQIINYQEKQIKRIISIAYERSPFYRKKYDQAGFNPESFKSLGDIYKIPLLAREEIQKNSKDMIIRGKCRPLLYKLNTSGTTGSSLVLYGDMQSRSREWASLCYIWRTAGYNPGDMRIEFRGKVPKSERVVKHLEQGVIRINANNINKNTIKYQNDTIVNSGCTFFSGYPSAIAKYSDEIRENNLKPPQGIKGIFLSSEIVYDFQISKIREIFPAAKIISYYGMTEKVGLAVRADLDDEYAFVPTYSLVERDKKTGFLVGTSFVNTVMPLIRYVTGDIVSELKYSERAQQISNANLFPAADSIEGRLEDMLVKTTGERVPPAILTWPFKNLRHIRNSMIIQESIGSVTLLVEACTGDDKTKVEIDHVVKELSEILGKDTQIVTKIVDAIPGSKSGKYKWIISKV